MKISVCMIVKNEQDNLENCLKSLGEIADEVVVVDTGSIDTTVAIAQKYTDKIYNYNWCNDFSEARNYSISKSKNDWVLIMDADEVVEKYDINGIWEVIASEESVVGRIKIKNIIDELSFEKVHTENICRLFNKKYYFYSGKIHEQLTGKNSETYRICNVPIEVKHFGYTDKIVKEKKKIERNSQYLLDMITEHPIDPYLHYQLGKTYFMAKDYEKASTSFKHALDLGIDFKFEYAEDLIESYGYSLINSNRSKEAISILEYQSMYNDNADFTFLVATILMNNALFKEAAETFLKCLEQKEGKMVGTNSFLAYYNIGVIFECLGFKKEAIEYYEKCGDYVLAKKRISLL